MLLDNWKQLIVEHPQKLEVILILSGNTVYVARYPARSEALPKLQRRKISRIIDSTYIDLPQRSWLVHLN